MSLKNGDHWCVEREEVIYPRKRITQINDTTIAVVDDTRADTVNTYIWETDGGRDIPGVQNPESLADPWRIENRGLRDTQRRPRGEYVEIFRRPVS